MARQLSYWEWLANPTEPPIVGYRGYLKTYCTELPAVVAISTHLRGVGYARGHADVLEKYTLSTPIQLIGDNYGGLRKGINE